MKGNVVARSIKLTGQIDSSEMNASDIKASTVTASTIRGSKLIGNEIEGGIITGALSELLFIYSDKNDTATYERIPSKQIGN
ncbi:hypothetical protein [Paenibacillus sp. 8b26]|uniref:hypothetical protein n=1 Tax=Paenibacillus sp. 8b26 TaxID=3424133 RepID=UPI003D65C2E7